MLDLRAASSLFTSIKGSGAPTILRREDGLAMYRAKAEDLWREHTERTDLSSRKRGATWDEHTQLELHEKLSAVQNRARFGLGFIPNGLMSNATCVRVQRTCGSAATSSNSSKRDRSSTSSSRHALDGSSKFRQVSVQERLSSPYSCSKLERSNAPSRPRCSRGADGIEGCSWASDSCSRRRSTRRSSSRSRCRTERRKRRSYSRASEASYHYRCRDALPRSRRDDRQREVCVGGKSPSFPRDAREMHAGEKGDEIRKRTLACQEAARTGDDRREVTLQAHRSRRRSCGTDGSHKENSSCTREWSMRIRERSPNEHSRSRKRGGVLGESGVSKEAGNIRGGHSSSKNSAHGREERESTHSSRRPPEKEMTQHTEGYRCNHEKDGSSGSHMRRPRKESTSRSSSCVAPSTEHSGFAKDKSRFQTSDGSAGGREAAENGCSRGGGGSQCREAFPRDAGLCSCGDKESKQHVGDRPTAAAIGACEEEKRQGGTVPGRTAELPTLCHGSAQEALKQRIREKLREVEQRQGKCSAAETRGPGGSGVKPVLTAREGRLLICKQLITAESQEAFERSDSRGSPNAALDRQGKEQVDEEVQRILEHEDVTRFTAFLERKRREKLQAAEMRKSAPRTENLRGTGDADLKRKKSGVSSSGNHHGEDSHLDAIFGRNVPDSLKCNNERASETSTTPCRTTALAAEVVTTTLPGLKGMALLADAVVMQSGNLGAGWKLRRQLQRQQKLGQ